MAIVKMDKISLIGLEADKEKIMEALMRLGCVELIDIQHRTSDEEWSHLVFKDEGEVGISEYEASIVRVKTALDYLSRYNKGKKGLFDLKRSVEQGTFKNILKNEEAIWNVVDQINKYDEDLNTLRSEENRLRNLIATLQPWSALSVPLELTATRSTVISIGVIPAIADTEKMTQELYEQVEYSYIQVINTDREQSYLMVVYFNTFEDDAMKVLKQYGFVKASFKDIEGTADDNIVLAGKRIKEIESKRTAIEDKIAQLAHEREQIEILYDHLAIQRDRKKALGNVVKTQKTFLLEGWVPSRTGEKVEKQITGKWDCVFERRKPDAEEEHPILLENHSLVKPFELITQLYSLPSSKGIDPNLFMAPFYFLFFGLMLSDAGYGLIMMAIAGFMLYKFKLEGMAHKFTKLILLVGFSTFVWGALFGGWFGNIVQAVTGERYTIPALWFEPIRDPMKLLIWSFIFGGIQIFVGMGLQAYKLIRDGRYLDAVFDVGCWYVFLLGLVFLILGGGFAMAGKYMAIGGAVLLVLTQGRQQKSIVKKLLMGILSLYNLSGYLSDVLSYSRLLALGLATGVIATVINTMGTIMGMNIPGIILLVVIFLVGHTFNLLINALGAYVHASRLQYVEFFGKFYDGGGKSFEPFKINTKYINLDDREAN